LSSDAADNSAVALFGTERVQKLVDDRVPRGSTVAALASAWYHQMDPLRGSVRVSDGLTMAEAAPIIACAVGRATDAEIAFYEFRQSFDRLRLLKAASVSPLRFKAGDVLGRRATRDDVDDEEEGHRNQRRCSPSMEGGAE